VTGYLSASARPTGDVERLVSGGATLTAGHDRKRARLHLLDACLEGLEADHERGRTQVSGDLAGRFGPFVDGLTRGMPISMAIKAVFREQAQCLRPTFALSEPELADGLQRVRAKAVNRVLTRGEALHLTNEIKTKSQAFSVLLVEAHDRKAWSALAYDSWAQYVGVELGLSRSRSYELLDHGRILIGLAAAAGMSGIPDISPYAAAQVKPHLEELKIQIAQQAVGRTEPEARELVASVVSKMRGAASAVDDRDNPRGSSQAAKTGERFGGAIGVDIDAVVTAIELLASMPPATAVLESASLVDLARLKCLPAAARWLTDMADGCAIIRPEFRVIDSNRTPVIDSSFEDA
jgi:hypothetical protein